MFSWFCWLFWWTSSTWLLYFKKLKTQPMQLSMMATKQCKRKLISLPALRKLATIKERSFSLIICLAFWGSSQTRLKKEGNKAESESMSENTGKEKPITEPECEHPKTFLLLLSFIVENCLDGIVKTFGYDVFKSLEPWFHADML